MYGSVIYAVTVAIAVSLIVTYCWFIFSSEHILTIGIYLYFHCNLEILQPLNYNEKAGKLLQ